MEGHARAPWRIENGRYRISKSFLMIKMVRDLEKKFKDVASPHRVYAETINELLAAPDTRLNQVRLLGQDPRLKFSILDCKLTAPLDPSTRLILPIWNPSGATGMYHYAALIRRLDGPHDLAVVYEDGSFTLRSESTMEVAYEKFQDLIKFVNESCPPRQN